MLSLRSLTITVVAAALLAGCAVPASQTATDEPREERVYRTGSNLPMRDRDQRIDTVDPRSIDTTMPTPKGRGG
jgi:type IV pilus biogenesis protein CpaD/CtpE